MRFLFMDLWNTESILHLGVSLGLDLLMVSIVVLLGYKRQSVMGKGFVFTFYIFNLIIFFICYLLSAVELSLGFGFGLFALFSILRYRTITIDIREMTFLFVVIALGIINALPYKSLTFSELLLIDAIIVASVFVLHKLEFGDGIQSLLIRYERIEFVKSNQKLELLADLKARTGLEIVRFEIESINFMTDTAEIRVYYKKAE